MKRQVLTLVGGSLIFAAAAILLSRLLWPDLPVPLYSSVAVALCLLPALISFVWAAHGLKRAPEYQLLTILGGTGLRMVLVFGSSLVLYYRVPEFHRMSFWIVILVFYLFTLALEVVLSLPVKDQRK